MSCLSINCCFSKGKRLARLSKHPRVPADQPRQYLNFSTERILDYCDTLLAARVCQPRPA